MYNGYADGMTDVIGHAAERPWGEKESIRKGDSPSNILVKEVVAIVKSGPHVLNRFPPWPVSELLV